MLLWEADPGKAEAIASDQGISICMPSVKDGTKEGKIILILLNLFFGLG